MENSLEENIARILNTLEPGAERLEKTPKRVARSYQEFFAGYNTDIQKTIQTTYDSDMDDLVILRNIPFESHCEHHMLPIIGTATVGYIPNKKIIGVSKLARIVDCFANRLQLQERLTIEIAMAVNSILTPLGVAVYIDAEHFCMSHRGVKKQGARFITKYFLGNIKSNSELRAEFLAECSGQIQK